MSEDQIRSQFRIPAKVYDWLKEQAAREHRSINGQLNAELAERMKATATQEAA
ncbi:Arc family DNA-binding protein [Stenotrophomonas maltophilia]|uniref:Arc family DNA-binding protein n=1 Tax=Stenotrophomonas maltophilia TaxID=40324 RepID=UPI002E78B0F5|nr:Arc family DNA-binding protein [Stenotrophomonas maltophilia]